MVKRFKITFRIVLLIMFLSIIKVSAWVDEHVNHYAFTVTQSFIFRVTRLNWQYGFFTSKSDKYQYLKNDISLIDPTNPVKNIIIAKNGGLDKLVLPINAVRVNTSIQQMVRDTLYLEVGSRSISLFLFNKYKTYRNIDFSIQAHQQKIEKDGNHFKLMTRIDTVFNRRIAY